MKKLFLVFLVLLVGMTGLSAAPPQPDGAGDVMWMIMPLADSAVSITAPGVMAPMRPGGRFVAQGNDAAVTLDIELICLWAGQLKEGLLTENDFKTLVVGRITVLYMREQILRGILAAKAVYPIDRTGGMRIRAAETRKKIDSQFKVSLAPDEFPYFVDRSDLRRTAVYTMCIRLVFCPVTMF